LVGKFFGSLACVALILFAAAAHAYHHPGDAAPPPSPSKQVNPIWNIMGIALLSVFTYIIWKAFFYQKKLSK